MADAELLPREEPEVAELKRWPKPGSQQWIDRYQETRDLLEKLHAAIPSTDLRVKLAMVELAEAIRDDVFRVGGDG